MLRMIPVHTIVFISVRALPDNIICFTIFIPPMAVFFLIIIRSLPAYQANVEAKF